MNTMTPNITKLPDDKGAAVTHPADSADMAAGSSVDRDGGPLRADAQANTSIPANTQNPPDALDGLRKNLDQLIEKLPSMAEAELNAAKDQLLQQMSAAKASVDGAAVDVRASFRQGVNAASGYVRESPFSTVAVTAGVGILIGMLMARR